MSNSALRIPTLAPSLPYVDLARPLANDPRPEPVRIVERVERVSTRRWDYSVEVRVDGVLCAAGSSAHGDGLEVLRTKARAWCRRHGIEGLVVPGLHASESRAKGRAQRDVVAVAGAPRIEWSEA